MKLIFIKLCFLTAITMSSGCIAAAILESGKSIDHLCDSKTSINIVRKCLGEPVWIQKYPEPIPICKTPEFITWEKNHDPQDKPFIWGVDKEAKESLTSICEEYQIKGPLEDPQRGVPYGMAIGMTLFLAELADPFVIPDAIKWQREHANDISWLTYWYDSNEKYVGYYEGDIRGSDKHSPDNETKTPIEKN